MRRILRDTTEHLTPEGMLVCEIGRGRSLILRDFDAQFPRWAVVPFQRPGLLTLVSQNDRPPGKPIRSKFWYEASVHRSMVWRTPSK